MWDEDPTYQLTFFFQDDDGATGKVILHLPVALSNYAKDFCLALSDLFRTVSNCALIKFRISMSASAITPIIPVGSASRYGVFIFATSTSGRCIYGIPGIKSSAIITTGDGVGVIIDTSNSDVAAYVAYTINGSVSPWNDDIIGLNVAGVQLRPYLLEKRDMR